MSAPWEYSIGRTCYEEYLAGDSWVTLARRYRLPGTIRARKYAAAYASRHGLGAVPPLRTTSQTERAYHLRRGGMRDWRRIALQCGFADAPSARAAVQKWRTRRGLPGFRELLGGAA